MDESTKQNVALRLTKYTKVSADNSYNGSPCHEWTGHTVDDYGRLTVQIDGKPATLRAHRLSYEVEHGAFDAELMVLHHCDNPKCINAEHLFLGTGADNMADKSKKGRSARMSGSTNPGAKLTEDDIPTIRNLLSTHEQKEVAAMYGVAQPTISDIANNRTWKHVI